MFLVNYFSRFTLVEELTVAMVNSMLYYQFHLVCNHPTVFLALRRSLLSFHVWLLVGGYFCIGCTENNSLLSRKLQWEPDIQESLFYGVVIVSKQLFCVKRLFALFGKDSSSIFSPEVSDFFLFRFERRTECYFPVHVLVLCRLLFNVLPFVVGVYRCCDFIVQQWSLHKVICSTLKFTTK